MQSPIITLDSIGEGLGSQRSGWRVSRSAEKLGEGIIGGQVKVNAFSVAESG